MADFDYELNLDRGSMDLDQLPFIRNYVGDIARRVADEARTILRSEVNIDTGQLGQSIISEEVETTRTYSEWVVRAEATNPEDGFNYAKSIEWGRSEVRPINTQVLAFKSGNRRTPFAFRPYSSATDGIHFMERARDRVAQRFG